MYTVEAEAQLGDKRRRAGRVLSALARSGLGRPLTPIEPQRVLKPERFDLVLAVGHEDDGHARVDREGTKHPEQPRTILRRETMRGLVQQQQPRPFHNGPTEQDQLLLSEREVAKVARLPGGATTAAAAAAAVPATVPT